MKHGCKELEKMIAEAKLKGFRFEQRRDGIMAYSPNRAIPPRVIHVSEKGLHPFRRWVNNPAHCVK
jgi:hypothetical protein